MGLSCDCGWDDYDWYYDVEDEERYALTDFRCYGCGKHYFANSIIRRVREYEMDEDGDEIILGYKRLCETCCDLYDSLTELGFCMSADQGFIKEAHQEYISEYVPRKFDKP